MGRSTRQQQQQPPTQTVTKLPKDYSKQKLLRNKSVKQELLLSSTTRRSLKLNAVMQMDPPGSRRRLGRNPIAEQQQQQQQQDSSSSPTDADSSNEAVPGGSGGNSAECRRSSRKKTIKFDVRDLLNKNRKSHKIQIEARIDSNAPKIGAGQVSKAELDSKQKNFIEKSAIFRRYSISENKLPPRPPPPPGALIHTIQQCVGELEQLPLEGGELNLAAISPIARRLSRTQDILTASMMKPKQVSSLIVTKLESASTSKAAVAVAATTSMASLPARRRLVGVCEPSTSKAIQQQKPPPKRGRKPKAKIFAESTTESSSSLSSNDDFNLSAAKKRSSLEKAKFKDELNAIGRNVTLIDENSTTGIDLKENLDASAVTLPLPKILTDSMHNSTDDSFVAAEEDLFTRINHSSDESTTESVKNSPKDNRRTDEISLFGRSNSTETNSSDDSEKRRRKIRISVKRVSLSPQKSPLQKCFEDQETVEPIELLSSSNSENSNEGSKITERKPTTKSFKGKLVETCATPPIIVLESDTSNAASVGSSVIEITSSSKIPIEKPDSSSIARRVRSCKLMEEEVLLNTTSSHEINFKAVQKSTTTTTAPQHVEISLRNRSSSRKSAPHLPIENIAASIESINNLKDDDAQSIENAVSPKEDDMVRVEDGIICKDIPPKDSPISVKAIQKESEEICQQKSEFDDEIPAPKVRSLRSAQSVQAKSPSPTASSSKKQRKSNKAQAAPSEIHTESDSEIQIKEVSDKEVQSPTVQKDDQLEISLPDERKSPRSDGHINSDAPQSPDLKQSLRLCKNPLDQTPKKSPTDKESDKEEQLTLLKQTRSRSMRKLDKSDDLNLTEDTIGTKDPSLPEEALTTENATKHSAAEAEEDSKSERESIISSTDRSSTDTTTSSDRRRESLRLRPSTAPTKQKQTSKKISKVIANSSTPDSSSESSECHEKSPKNSKQIQSANVMMDDDKSKEETSSLCSQSSSNGSSKSSSSSSSSSLTGSSSTNSSSSSASSSSSSTSSSSSSSSSSEGRSTRSSRNILKVSLEQQQHQVEVVTRNKSPVSPGNIVKKQSNKSDSECSESFSNKDSIKEKFNEIEKLGERRNSLGLERWSSDPERDTDQSESSVRIQNSFKTRSGRSRGRVEKAKEEEIIKKLPSELLHQDPASSEVQKDKIAAEETLNDTTDKSPTNQENKTDAPQTDKSISPRAKSKKRIRRFVPIKYSSSESGTLSDDGNPPDKYSSIRLTRTRRKTISSASEIEDITATSLSPPDLALEYMPRKSRQAEIKETTNKKDEELIKPNKEDPPENENNMSKTEEEPTPMESKSKISRSRKKGIRNASKYSGGSGVKSDDSTDISKESESDQSSKEIGRKHEIQHSEPASPSPSSSSSSSGSSEVDSPGSVLRQRKVTRLSLKTQLSDPGNNESPKNKDLESSIDKNEIPQKGDIEKLPEDGKDKKSTILVEGENCLPNKDVLSTSATDILDSEFVSQSKLSPKQRKGTKLFAKGPINLRSKQENKEKDSEQKVEEIDEPKDEIHQLEKSPRNRQVNKDSQNSSTINDLEKSPGLKKVTRSSNNVPSTEIKSHDLSLDNSAEKNKDDNNELQEDIHVEGNKEEDTSKSMEIAKFSGTRKGTRLSMKKLETTNSEKTGKEKSENDEKTTEIESMLDVSKSNEVLKTPKQRKPTRFSPKSPEQHKHEESVDQQAEEDSKKNDKIEQAKEDSKMNDKIDQQKESSPRLRKTTRLSPKSLNLQDIEVVQSEDNQPVELKTDSSTENSQKDTAEAVDGPINSILIEEPLNSLSDALKLTETPKRKRKPTRFSPRSPDKQPTIEIEQTLVGSDAILNPLADEKIEVAPIDGIDEVKRTDEPDSNSKSFSAIHQPEVVQKSPRIRKGTRFSPKNPDILQIQQESLKTKELELPIDNENKDENQSVSEIFNVSSSSLETTHLKEPATKTTKGRKGTRFLGKNSENLQIEEELKKMLDDSKPDFSINSSLETKQLQETVKSSRAKKGTRLALQAQDSPMIDGKNKDELQVKKVPVEFEDDTSKNSRQKRKTAENEPSVPVDISITSTDTISKNKSEEQIPQSQSLVELSQETDISNLQTFAQEDPTKYPEKTNLVIETKSVPELTDSNVAIPSSPSIPSTFKSEITSKKGLKKKLQSMLDSLTSVEKVTITQKETTPRRKKKTLGQEPITPAEDSPTPNKIDDIDMKVLSSESNLSDDSIKPQDGTSKIDQKSTSRRQLDSSFIESLEQSLLRPVATKKSSKKKEKDKETVVVEVPSPLPKLPKEESLKKSNNKKSLQDPPCEELKKPETSSPKLKKKQPKESPKSAKKHSEEQTASKRKSLAAAAAKAKEQEEIKIKLLQTDLSLSDVVLKDDSLNKQSSKVIASPVVVTQTPKTKAETKFFSSPEKSLIQHEPPPVSPPLAIVPEPVAPVVIVKEKSPDLLPDPLKDIEKFIEDGVNLLKRCYKIDADDDTSLDRDLLKPEEMMTPKKCKLDESVVSVEMKSDDPPQDDDNSNSNSESSTMTTNTSTSEVDTPNGIRRSHRIKNSKSTKCLVGRGLVRERERFSTKDDEKTIYSIDDQKMDLAEVEAKNSQFLKDMEERLSNFRVIRENEYKCERVISKEAKRMICDCFLTHEEEERGELGCGEDCLNRLLMIECGGDCTVRERCTNRRFNKFLYSPCRVFRTEKKGFGIMADIEILPGEFIMEYVGEVINGDEFEIRINEYSKDKNKHYYFMALRSDAVIDATAKGNISRFINHSCDPNAETQKWTVNGELRIGFFSRKSIMPGEEITFDYQYQRYGKEAQRCYCESSNCRGWIGAEPSSEEEEGEYEGVDEEDESEDSEEEELPEAVAPVVVPVIPSPIPTIIMDIAKVEEQPLVPAVVAATEIPAIDVEMVPPSLITVPQPAASPIPLAEPKVPTEVPKEIPKEQLPLKKKKEKKRLLEEKLKRREPKLFLEDPDIEDEVRFLVKCGLRNQADTLRLSRLIVRAKLLETRINLLQILRQGELPCRRLFLDYHGLRLLHGWMSEVIDTRDTEKSMEIRMELLSALECLPISNKTMLTDSKVYQTVRDWSNNKESHSPSDQSPKQANANNSSASASPTTSVAQTDASSELQKLAAKLVHTWDNLPEVFRIPKRERIEQMKEHEREADRQYKVLERGGMMSGSDRHRNKERFISKSGQKGRFNWSKEKERERANERRKYIQNNSNGKDGADKSTGSLAGESHLSKEQRRELFAAKVARDEAEKRLAEERREFDIKCRFFGLDPKRMRPENMPFCVDPSTGQWYSIGKKAISTPPSYAHVQVPVKPKSTNPEDYRLPEMDLPPLWKFAISPKGKIYYYHVKIRIPQWEPPIKILPLAGQHNTEVKNSESDSSTAGINDSSEDDIEVIKGLDPVKLQTYIEKKIEDRRLQRYNRLVEEKPISPRKEEDRIYNQMEVRKYKENKEKIRKRKEEIRKRRDIIGKQQTTLDSSNLSETTAAIESVLETLPIQDYLLSSEEEEIIKAECNNSPLIDKIVQGDKIVDELDALHRKRSLKRSLPNRDKYEHKKRKLDKNKDSSKSTKRNKDGEGSSSSSKYRKVREKFRCEIAGIIVQHLKPYRNESCFTGKILTDDDFNHLARKLTHFVMVKELKYCESIGQTLIVTESVKNKSREFIKKYMAKYGKVYVRPKNDPEFKDIPFL